MWIQCENLTGMWFSYHLSYITNLVWHHHVHLETKWHTVGWFQSYILWFIRFFFTKMYLFGIIPVSIINGKNMTVLSIAMTSHGRPDVSNHQQLDCFCNSLSRAKGTAKVYITNLVWHHHVHLETKWHTVGWFQSYILWFIRFFFTKMYLFGIIPVSIINGKNMTVLSALYILLVRCQS